MNCYNRNYGFNPLWLYHSDKNCFSLYLLLSIGLWSSMHITHILDGFRILVQKSWKEESKLNSTINLIFSIKTAIVMAMHYKVKEIFKDYYCEDFNFDDIINYIISGNKFLSHWNMTSSPLFSPLSYNSTLQQKFSILSTYFFTPNSLLFSFLSGHLCFFSWIFTIFNFL